MSIKYEWLYNTTYPDKIQEFEEKLNITPNDATLIKQVQQLIEQRKFAEANAIRQQIPNYKQKQIIAQDFNTVFDTTVALQLEYDSRYTPSYVLSKKKPTNQSEGDYWYRITNIKYFGETEEIGTGEKSPDNPYILKGLEVPDTEITLYSLPSGVCDEYNAQTGVLTKRIGKVILDGNSNFNLVEINDKNYIRFDVFYVMKNAKLVDRNKIQTNKFITKNPWDDIWGEEYIRNSTIAFGENLVCYMKKDRLKEYTNTSLKEWLSLNPIEVYYELETPQIIQL